MRFKIFGIEIERKTDILAFAAFVISIGGLIGQLAILLRGPDVSLYPPENVLITKDDRNFLRLSALMIYINTGSSGYNDIVKKEKVFFTLGNKKIEFNWDDYIDATANGDKLNLNRKSDAIPEQVNAGGVLTHETYFAPWETREGKDTTFIEWKKFLSEISSQKQIDFTFYFESFDGQKGQVTCTVNFAEYMIYLKGKGWSVIPCKV